MEFLYKNLIFMEDKKVNKEKKKPESSLKLSEYFYEFGKSVDNTFEMLQMLAIFAKNAGSDVNEIIYWLAVSAGILSDIQTHKNAPFSGDVLCDGVKPPDPELNLDEFQDGNAEDLECIFNIFIFDIYSILLSQIYKKLNSLIENCFVLQKDSGAASRNGFEFIHPTNAKQNILDLFSTLLNSFLDHEIPSVFISQCFSQVSYYLSAGMFNKLISSPSYCTPATSLHIKFIISSINNWFSQQASSLPIFSQFKYASFFQFPLFLSISFLFCLFLFLFNQWTGFPSVTFLNPVFFKISSTSHPKPFLSLVFFLLSIKTAIMFPPCFSPPKKNTNSLHFPL